MILKRGFTVQDFFDRTGCNFPKCFQLNNAHGRVVVQEKVVRISYKTVLWCRRIDCCMRMACLDIRARNQIMRIHIQLEERSVELTFSTCWAEIRKVPRNSASHMVVAVDKGIKLPTWQTVDIFRNCHGKQCPFVEL